MGEKENKYAPVKRFVFPAGDCGGEIRINIPVTASKSDVIGIGDRIKNRLDEIGMSQRELADKCKLTEVSMSRYINGTRTPKAPMVCIMAKALYTTPNSLLGWEDAK